MWGSEHRIIGSQATRVQDCFVSILAAMPMAVVWTQIASAASWLCEPSKPGADELERSKSQLQDEVEQLQSVLEETRYMLSHEQRLVTNLCSCDSM